jgi:hypothetical protein
MTAAGFKTLTFGDKFLANEEKENDGFHFGLSGEVFRKLLVQSEVEWFFPEIVCLCAQ